MTEIAELSALVELSKQLTTPEKMKIQTIIDLPPGLCKDASEGTEFFKAIKRWKQHDPYKFYLTLKDMRSDLISGACKIPWLCVLTPSEFDPEEKELTIKTLIGMLKSEISRDTWGMIYLVIAKEQQEDADFEMTLNALVEHGYIQADLRELSLIMKAVRRDDIVEKLKPYREAFSGMGDEEFESKFKRETLNQGKEMKQWEHKLKDFANSQFTLVKQMLGDKEAVSLEKVFVELTILKQEPREIDMEDETTYNEIAYLRKIANKEVTIEPCDFTEELNAYEQKDPEIWCLIGNPGCGKTFLAKRTALRFSDNELGCIKYSISIPCRNTEWHAMESTRHEEKKKVEPEFIQKWLCLGLPVGSSWSNDLAKHLSQSDGEGLLLIIDGLDEFPKKVPFEDTFLCLLLTRQSFTKATIILTSRPGAWTVISSSHELKINRFYQVLGFSPDNRDLYFKKQITNESKLKACWDLMERHDEMKQLSLIPVNASLFAALLKGEDSASINTLTKLYYELTLYLIRRELSRMGLKESSRVSRIADFHPDILQCLHKIAFIALLGVANRDLVSEESVPLIMGQEVYTCQCLGLAHEHYRKESIGLFKAVWTFAHLTMQEFVSALWLEHTTWTQQCYSVRYISHSMDNFSLFRMVLRFLCGLLSDKAAAIIAIVCRYLTPQPIQLIGMPMVYQLKYEPLYHHQAWDELTELYIQSTTIIYETNSISVPNWFANFKQFLTNPMYLYIEQTVSPNDWICFIQSLRHISHIQLIRIDTRFINSAQFSSLMREMRICSVGLLSLHFHITDSTAILPYTDILRETGMQVDTKISIELYFCDLSAYTAVNLFASTANQFISCMRLVSNRYSSEVIQQLSQHLSAVQSLSFEGEETDYASLLPSLCQATQLTLLHLEYIPTEYLPALTAALPHFSQLQEIAFNTASLLPAVTHLSNLTYLLIGDDEMEEATLSVHLLNIINQSRHSLRGMDLGCLKRIGFNSWSLLLNSLEFCTNLVQLKILQTTLPSDDVTPWSRAVNRMTSLVELDLYTVSLSDTEFLSLCGGLIYHPAIRSLEITSIQLTSLSCDPLTNLIPTVSQLETLTVMGLSSPNGDPILLLRKTADKFNIEHNLR